jgi:nucleoside-diphosphate-sugar epimerase
VIHLSRDREFDVIVYGATGFTGRLVAEYLAERYGVDVRGADSPTFLREALCGGAPDAARGTGDECVSQFVIRHGCVNLCS